MVNKNYLQPNIMKTLEDYKMPKPKLIMIEGARNVGKSYLIDSLGSNIQTFKFPFAKYFDESFAKDFDSIESKKLVNSRKELYYLTLGYDITILDMMKNGIIKNDIILDRGFLSNIIFGIQSGRISEKEGWDAWSWLDKEYADYYEIIYISCALNDDIRNKDMWEIYNQKQTMDLYDRFVGPTCLNMFINYFNEESVKSFNELISEISSRKV